MKTNSLFWALSWVAVGSFAVMQGCGGDDDDGGDGDGSSGGKGGSAGSGTGGKAGSSSTGGKAGSAGSSTSGAGGAPGGAGGEGGSSVGGEGGGGQTRGEVCVDYCSTYFTNACNTTINPANTYADQATCEFVCANSAWELGAPGEVGNTVWCRLDHANNAAATATRATHCGHASETPTGVCI